MTYLPRNNIRSLTIGIVLLSFLFGSASQALESLRLRLVVSDVQQLRGWCGAQHINSLFWRDFLSDSELVLSRSGEFARVQGCSSDGRWLLVTNGGYSPEAHDPPPGEIVQVKTVQTNGNVLFSLPEDVEPASVRLIDLVVNRLGDGTSPTETVWRIENKVPSDDQAKTISWPITYAESVGVFDILIGPVPLTPGLYSFNADVEVSSRSPTEKRRLLMLRSSFALTDEMKLK